MTEDFRSYFPHPDSRTTHDISCRGVVGYHEDEDTASCQCYRRSLTKGLFVSYDVPAVGRDSEDEKLREGCTREKVCLSTCLWVRDPKSSD